MARPAGPKGVRRPDPEASFPVYIRERIGTASDPVEAFDSIVRRSARGPLTDNPTEYTFAYHTGDSVVKFTTVIEVTPERGEQ